MRESSTLPLSDEPQPRTWWARIGRSRFVRAAAVLVGGTAAAQVIGIALMPVLTRLYSPDDFGALAAFMATTAILATGATLRYESAIPLPEAEESASDLVWLCLSLVGISTLVVAGAAWAVGPSLGAIGLAALDDYLWAVPLGFLVMGLYNTSSAWAIRQRRYRTMAGARMGQALTQGGGQVGLSFAASGPLGLLLGTVAGYGMAAIVNARLLRGRVGAWSAARVKAVALRYRRFPAYMLGSQWLTAAGAQAPALLMVALFDPAAGGLFLLSQKVLGLPVNMLSRAVGQTFLGEGAALARRDRGAVRRLCRKTVFRLALIGLVPAVILMLVSEPAFVLLFGEAWRSSAAYVQLLAIPYLLKFAASPLAHAFVLIERQDLALAWSALRFVAMLVALVGAWAMTSDPAVAVGALAASMAFAYLAQFGLFEVAARRSADSTSA